MDVLYDPALWTVLIFLFLLLIKVPIAISIGIASLAVAEIFQEILWCPLCQE